MCPWLATCQWFFPGTPVFSTNKTGRHDIIEILLKVALKTIKHKALDHFYIEWFNVLISVEVNEDPEIGKEPSHRLGFSLFAIECRMDYMGTSVLMTRLSKLDIELKDEWHVETKYESDTPLATTR